MILWRRGLFRVSESIRPISTGKIFKVHECLSKHTRKTVALQEQCLSKIIPLGGGELKISCRTFHDTKRASKAAGADSVIAAYKVGDTPPVHPEDGTKQMTSTKATFIIECGPESGGKKLFLFTRWNDTKNPNRVGPWSGLNSSGIV